MMQKAVRMIGLFSLVSILAGCRLSIIVNEGGQVVAFSGANGCAESSVCSVDVDSTTFSDSFTVIPAPGYEFVRWQGGEDFLCGDSTSTVCNITLMGSAIDQFLVNSFKTGYIMPVFKNVGIDTDNDGIRNELDDDDDNDGIFDVSDVCPLDPDPMCGSGIAITDTVIVDGKEWVQADLFFGLSWNDIDAVCNDGPCAGVLNGWNMSGWTWASLAEVDELMNVYIGLPVPATSYSEDDSTWAPAFFFDGWRPGQNTSPSRSLPGFPRDHPLVPHPSNPSVMIEIYFCTEMLDRAGAGSITDEYYRFAFASCNTPIGAWIYRDL